MSYELSEPQQKAINKGRRIGSEVKQIGVSSCLITVSYETETQTWGSRVNGQINAAETAVQGGTADTEKTRRLGTIPLGLLQSGHKALGVVECESVAGL